MNESMTTESFGTGAIALPKFTITNSFVFPLVMSHKEIAKPFIEAALGIKIYDLKEPEQEKTEQVSIFNKSVRYDVFTQQIDEKGKTIRSFDLEMQVKDTKELPKRARYYQSIRDTHELHRGTMYKSLKDQYVLFICPDDIFGDDLPIYSFQNFAVENKDVALNDRTFKNFYIFNAYDKLPDAHPLKPYLKYFATNTADSTETEEIDTKVKWYQTDNQTQERYMTWEQEIQLAREDEREKATAKERERNQKIIEEKDRALTEKDRALTEKDRALTEKDRALTEQARKIAELEAQLAKLQK